MLNYVDLFRNFLKFIIEEYSISNYTFNKKHAFSIIGYNYSITLEFFFLICAIFFFQKNIHLLQY